MMKNLSRDPSLRTFENEETSIFGTNPPKTINNFFALTNKRNERYSQKSFQCFYTAKGQRSKNHSTLNRVNSQSNFNENKSLNRKPLNEILKSNKEPSFHGMSRSQKDKILYKIFKTETNSKHVQNQNSINKITHQESCQKNVSNFNTFQDYQTAVQKNLSFIKLRQNVQHVKKLQNQLQKSFSRSRSNKRKGLQCTLYQKSLQKKINESGIKSNKKLVTVKKRFQKTENQWSIDQQAPKKDIKKVLLKRKNKDNENTNQASCFNSIIINQNFHKKNDENMKKININSGSLSKVQQNIRSISKSKRTALNKLNQSMSLIKETCRNHNFESLKKESVQKKRRRSQSRQRSTVSKSKNDVFNQSSLTKGKKVTINAKIEQNLSKVHEKYKFILNYLSDFDIIGKLNGYELAGKQECRWILLLIDEVYEMIKHSAETKLKGIDYTRDYHYSTLKTE